MMNAMEPIPWDEKLATGVPRIDEQHQGLLKFLEKFGEPLTQAESKSVLLQCLRYTREHFADEEDHMVAIGYRRRMEHRGLHDAFVRQLVKHAEEGLRSETEREMFRVETSRWFLDHIQTHDADYVRHAREQSGTGRLAAKA